MRFLCVLPIAFSPVMWYNKYRKEREVNEMTQFERDVKIFTEHLSSGMISYLMIKHEKGTFIIETDEEKFYYDEETGCELS